MKLNLLGIIIAICNNFAIGNRDIFEKIFLVAEQVCDFLKHFFLILGQSMLFEIVSKIPFCFWIVIGYNVTHEKTPRI